MPTGPPRPPPLAIDLGPLQRVQLTRSLALWQRARGHRSATDDVLCAWAGLQVVQGAAPLRGPAQTEASRQLRLLDLGAGQGSVTLMLAGALPAAQVVAVEAQEISFQLLRHNIAHNDLGHRVWPVLGDLREVDLDAAAASLWAAPGHEGIAPLPSHGFDLATGSPPFVPPGAGTLPADAQRAAARFELRGGVEGYAQAAARWLRPGGFAVLLMDGAQDARSRAALSDAGLLLRRRVVVRPAPNKRPRYLIYVAQRPTRSAGQITSGVEDINLTVRGAEGAWTPAFAAARRALDLPGA